MLPFLLSQDTTEQGQSPSLLPSLPQSGKTSSLSLSHFNAAVLSSYSYLLASLYSPHVLYWEAQKWTHPPRPHQDRAEQKDPLPQPTGKAFAAAPQEAAGHLCQRTHSWLTSTLYPPGAPVFSGKTASRLVRLPEYPSARIYFFLGGALHTYCLWWTLRGSSSPFLQLVKTLWMAAQHSGVSATPPS